MRRTGFLPIGAAWFISLLGIQGIALGWMAPPDSVCAPRPDGRRCSDTHCPANNEKCLPSLLVCDAKGRCKVADCDCGRPNACHVDLAGARDAVRPVCEGECPPGAECEMKREAHTDGTTSVWCECVQQACEPTSTGLECQDHSCPDPHDRCIPQVAQCNANGQCRVVKCDCQPRDDCLLTLPRDGQLRKDDFDFCRGHCPAGSRCEETRTPLPDGGFEVSCGCVQEDCEPTRDGQRCRDFHCPDNGERCTPQAVECDANGDCKVIACDCDRPNRCHPEITNGHQDPPVICTGSCPDGMRCTRDVTPTASGGSIVRCDCEPIPTVCEPNSSGQGCTSVNCPNRDAKCVPDEVVCIPGAPCRVTKCDCDRSNRCHVQLANATGPVCVGDCPDGFDCERIQTPIAGGGFSVRCDCIPEPPKCEPEDTGFACKPAVCPAANEKCIPIAVAVSPNGNVRVLACDCRGPDDCHVVPSPLDIFPPQFDCAGSCPPGQECHERTITTDNGAVVTRCDCVPVEPQCGPNSTGTDCRPVTCSDPTQKCRPSKVFCGPNNVCRVVDCDCVGEDRCHVEVTAAAGPICVGDCPPGQTCKREVTTTTAGTFIECRCEPAVELCHAEVDPASNTVVCKGVCPPGSECRKTAVGGAVTCECQPVPPPCHREVDAAGNVSCVGVCPPGQTCTKVTLTDPNGNTFIDCRCEPVVEPCHAEVDPVTNTVVCKGACPPGSECRQTIVGGTVTCDCEPIQQACHREIDDVGNVICVGGCPAPLNCIRVTITNPDGTSFVDCRCQPLQQPCHREIGADGNFFCVGTCPPGQECKLTPVVNPDGTTTTDCFCEDVPQPCHAEVDPVTNTVICKGVCPPGSECRRLEQNGAVTCDCVPVQQPCHREIDVNGNVVCTGVCPPGQACKLTPIVNPDGTVTTDCFCVDVPQPCHAEVDPATNAVICKGVCPPGMECRRFEANGAVTCDCVPVQQPCHREIDANGNVVCTGVCPPGQACKLTPIVNPDGTVTTDCFCVDVPQPCHAEVDPATNAVICKGVCPPGMECRRFEANGAVTCDCAPIVVPCQPDPTTSTGCSNSVCPTGETCIPIAVSVTASGAVTVIACDCRGPNECHIVPSGPAGVIPPQFDCAGTCPTGFVCQEVNLSTTADDTITRCDCLPQPACDPDPSSPTGCHQVECPDATLRCLPVRANCLNGACRVVECECQPPDRCHVIVSTTGASCAGGCPLNDICTRFESTTDEGEMLIECGCVSAP